MAVTRRSERFAQLATAAERECLVLEVVAPPGAVDALLNQAISKLGFALRLCPRVALEYVADDLPAQVARSIATSVSASSSS